MNTHNRVAITVVWFLGTFSIVGIAGVIVLVHTTIGYDKIDPSTVALVSGVSTLVGAGIGALGGLLASTSGRGSEPTPVVVENSKADPVQVEAQTAGTNPDVQIHDDAPASSDL